MTFGVSRFFLQLSARPRRSPIALLEEIAMRPFDDPEVCRAVLDSLSVGVYLVDRDQKILFWNGGAERISGFLRHEVVGRTCRDEILVRTNEHGCVVCATNSPLSAAIESGQHGEEHLYLHHRSGHRIPVLVRAVPIRDSSGAIIGAAESFDVPHGVISNDRREHPTVPPQYLDPLTHLANPTFCQVKLRIFLSTFAVEQMAFSVLLLRLPEQERFVAQHGAEAGRMLMRAIGETLGNTVRSKDLAGRWSDNEFLVILANCEISDAPWIAERITSVANAATIRWWGEELSAPVVFGVATAEYGDSLESLIERSRKSLEQGCRAAGASGT